MQSFKLIIAYDGTAFSGWQAQPRRRTVQGVLEEAWRKTTEETVCLRATSRTDAGVHALGQVVSVVSATHLSTSALERALNARLPDDVRVVQVELAPEGFHATRDARGKWYRYQIYNSRQRPLFERHFTWHVPQPLDTEAMQRAGQVLVGEHDFASFQSAGSPRESTVRTITEISVRRPEETSPLVWIEVRGDGFLYNMVRIIAGALVEVGKGRRDEAWLAEVLAARDRRRASQTAPPQGLVLVEVFFESPQREYDA